MTASHPIVRGLALLWFIPLAGAAPPAPSDAAATSRPAPPRWVTIHYHRYNGDYEQVGIWTWDEQLKRAPQQNELFPTGRDDFGLIFKLDTSQYGDPGDRIGLLPRMRRDWNYKDSGDRFWSPEMGDEIYFVQGRTDVYTTRPDVSPRLLGAALDTEDTLTLRFTHLLAPIEKGQVRVRDRQGIAYSVVQVTPVEPDSAGRTTTFSVRVGHPLDIAGRTYLVEVQGYPPQRVRLGKVLDSPRFYDPDARLGAVYTPQATTFGLFAPTAGQVNVVIAKQVRGPAGRQVYPMTRNEHGVWSATVPGDLNGRYYAYVLSGPGLDPEREVTDPAATCAQGMTGRALIFDPRQTDPPGFDPSAYVPLAAPTDAVVYELHVRDFTMDANSGARHQGRYLGLTESGTHLPADAALKTGLDHLVELGVTHVHLLPVEDFENDEARNAYNWGYVTMFFNTPEGAYATTPQGTARIREFKQLVQALHARGLGVVMDVVYNHTASQATFEQVAPGYYFRMRPDGSFWNGSGCGNEFASEKPMARKFIVDSLVYWATEYGIDGFRFDLMGLIDLETMEALRDRLCAINPSVLLYGEPWAAGPSGLARVTGPTVIRGTGVAAFNDHFRDAVKGSRDEAEPGFVQTGARLDGIRNGLLGAVYDWSYNPTDAISYCACHDNLTTWDKIVISTPGAGVPLRERMQRFAGLLVLSAQGMAFLHAGQEFCRTKGGNGNSYNAPDAVNQIDWSWKRAHHKVFTYYRGLIALRKAHPVFRLPRRDELARRLRFLTEVPGNHCLAYTLDGREVSGEPWATALVLLNGDSAAQTFRLPPGRWRVFVDADRADTTPLRDADVRVTLPPHSGMVLARE